MAGDRHESWCCAAGLHGWGGSVRFTYLVMTLILGITAILYVCSENSIIIRNHTIRYGIYERYSSNTQIKLASVEEIPRIKVKDVNCANLFTIGEHSGLTEATYIQSVMDNNTLPNDSTIYPNNTEECTNYIKTRGYLADPVSTEEKQFPIAFSLLVYKDLSQVERLLRAIYRPQNYYCIHADAKSARALKQGISGISSCFDNVFVTSRSVSVTWGTYSVLEPEILCMQELWKYTSWRYFINLTGQEFPLKTNWQLVQILKAYNGANDIQGSVKKRNKERTRHVIGTKELLEPPPGNLTITKGSVHIAASRAYVDFLLHRKEAQDLLEWVKKTIIPDETYFSMLNYNPQLGVPGAYLGEPETNIKNHPSMVREKNWGTSKCYGKMKRGICVVGLGDLPKLYKSKQMFVNKIYQDFQSLTLDCLEELHFNRTRSEMSGLSDNFNITYYESMPNLQNHI